MRPRTSCSSTCRWRRISPTTSFSSCGRSPAVRRRWPRRSARPSPASTRSSWSACGSVMTLEDIAWTATGRHRFRAVMVIAFAALALVLAMVGVFGILAYSVQQHVRDFGVRRALGATTNDVLRLVIVNAARVVATGAAIGLVLSAVCRPPHRDDAVRSAAAGSGDVRVRDDRAGNHRRAVDSRAGVACGANRSGRGAAELRRSVQTGETGETRETGRTEATGETGETGETGAYLVSSCLISCSKSTSDAARVRRVLPTRPRGHGDLAFETILTHSSAGLRCQRPALQVRRERGNKQRSDSTRCLYPRSRLTLPRSARLECVRTTSKARSPCRQTLRTASQLDVGKTATRIVCTRVFAAIPRWREPC